MTFIRLPCLSVSVTVFGEGFYFSYKNRKGKPQVTGQRGCLSTWQTCRCQKSKRMDGQMDSRGPDAVLTHAVHHASQKPRKDGQSETCRPSSRTPSTSPLRNPERMDSRGPAAVLTHAVHLTSQKPD